MNLNSINSWWGGGTRRAYVRECEEQLPETLELFANSLRAGMTFVQAMGVVAEEVPAPLGEEFRHVVQEHRLGLPIEESFLHLRGRVPSESLQVALAGILIARQSGGDMGAILRNLADAMRERRRLEEQMNVLTSQGRLSGWILGLLPFGLAGLLAVMDPSVMSPLFTTWKGFGLLALALMLEGIGAVIIRRIVTIDLS